MINAVLPCFVVGPILHAKQQVSNGKWVLDLWRDPGNFAPLRDFGGSFFIDAEDAALLHVAALTQEDVQNERLLGFAGTFNYNSWLDVVRQLDPRRAWPPNDPNQGHDVCKVDTRRK